MKTNMKTLVLIGVLFASTLALSSCQKENMNSENAQYASLLDVTADGTTSVIEANLKSAMITTTSLTDGELASLLKMKEEEKLARDVYTALNQKWNNTIFSHISTAESNHLNAIVLLLTTYGADATVGEPGVFANAEFQTLYTKLVADGSAAIEEAYKTGALIEEMDIYDLNQSLSSVTNANVSLVFENLVKGSRNHLRAFNRQLTALGIVYTPVYLSQGDYDLIVNSSMEKGKQYRMNGNGQGNGNGKGQKGNGNQGNGTCVN